MKLRVSGGLMRCGRCGRRYTNPFSHVCATTSARRAAKGSALAPKLSAGVHCPRCGKTYANPLTHVCAPKSDFKKRAAAAARARKAAARKPGRPAHDPARCRDKDCERAACEAYREGYDDGFADGLAAAEGR